MAATVPTLGVDQPRWIADAYVSRTAEQAAELGYGVYPQSSTHTWGAFACLAIELGGYGDFEIVDPYTGRRFWTPAFGNGDPDDNPTIYDALRRAIDAMEAHAFLTKPTEEVTIMTTIDRSISDYELVWAQAPARFLVALDTPNDEHELIRYQRSDGYWTRRVKTIKAHRNGDRVIVPKQDRGQHAIELGVDEPVQVAVLRLTARQGGLYVIGPVT